MRKSYTVSYEVVVIDEPLLLKTFEQFTDKYKIEVPEENENSVEFALYWLVTTDIPPHKAGYEIVDSNVEPWPAAQE